jgi:hypothetical protein
MEQMMVCLLAEIRINRERIEAKLGAEIKSIRVKMDSNQEKMDDGQETMKSQVAFLASRIDVNQREMIA